MLKAAKKIGKGLKRDQGKTWHPQLADKAAGIKTHVYYAMKNCKGSVQYLLNSLDNIKDHYRGQHQQCPPASRCRAIANYVPSRLLITDDKACELLEKCIKKLFIYKHPEKYLHCMDTHYVESFNNTALVYVDKRIHFKTAMYELRLHLAVLDWNEHVDREATSLRDYIKAKNPRAQTPSRVLKPKSFYFVGTLWRKFCQVIENGIAVNMVNDIEGLVECEDNQNENDENSFVSM